jgi:iron complex outermembrane recepter protein
MNRTPSALLLLLAGASAYAPAGLAQDRTQLEEIVVTAQRREQRLIDVPMSITAISGAELEQRGLRTVQDLSFAVPGLTMREDGPGSYTIFMRGLSNQYGTDALVGTYLDEAPLSLTGYDQLDTRMLDLERVEVLKGPQGTLYGQGAMAGAIRYITKAPVLDEFEAMVEASAGWVSEGDDRYSAGGVVNMPVVDDVFGLRLAARFERGGGWQDQPQAGIEDGNDQDLDNARLRARWNITDAFTADAMVVYFRNEVELGLGYENPDRTITVGIDRSRVLIPKKFEYDLYNLNLTYHFGIADLLSASTYIYYDHQYPFSYIGGPETIYGGELEGTDARYQDGNQFSQELRLTSTGDGPWHWTAGGFYRDLESDFLAIYDTLYFGVVYPDAIYIDDDTTESLSLYADASYDITDRLTVGAGVRYFEDEQTTFDGAASESDKFDSTDPRVYATYEIVPDVNVYASIASGFRSGGFNAGDLPNYQPESLVSYEIGTKGAVRDGTVVFDLAVYYSEYDDMLRRGLVFVPEQAQFLSLTSNIGKVEVKGAEAGATTQATEGLTLSGTVAYTDSEITEVNATDATSLPGDPVDYTPEWSYTLGAMYSFDWGTEMPGYVRLDYSYRDEVSYIDRTSFPPENLPQFADSIGLLDARIGLDWRSVSFEFYGLNLTDENRWIDPYYAWTNANRTRPREIGLRAAFRFD